MTPELYLSYLRSQKLVSPTALSSKMLMSYMPMGLDTKVWDAGHSEKFFLGRLRRLPGDVDLLSSFGIGGPSARTHLGLAIEAGVREIISVGTVGSLKSQYQIGDLVLLQTGGLDQEILAEEKLPQVQTQTVFDIWDNPGQSADVTEMEAQCLFAWCQEMNVKFSCIGVVSDLMQDGKWNPGFDRISDSLGRAHRLAYEVLVKKGAL